MKKLLLSLLIASTAFTSSFAALSDSIVAYYKFANGSMLVDSVAGTYNLTNNNSISATSSGIIEYGSDSGLTNVNKSLSVASNLTYTGGAMSMCVWGKFNVLNTSTREFIDIADSGSKTRILIQYYYSAPSHHLVGYRNKPGVGNDATDVVISSPGLTTWHHFCVTYDATTLILYYDGANIGSVAASGSGSSAVTSKFSFYTGDTTATFATMALDEAAVWVGRAITAAEVTSLYASGAPGVLQQYPFTAASTPMFWNWYF